MSLTDQINTDIKSAMKGREKDKLAVLRDIKAKLLIEATKGSGEVDSSTELKVLTKLYKQRIETAELYKTQGREDLTNEELSQAEVIKAYLPKQLSEDEIRQGVKDVIQQTGATSMADMGKVMGRASNNMQGKADGKTIAGIVKEMLS